jgi:hypothetical protein
MLLIVSINWVNQHFFLNNLICEWRDADKFTIEKIGRRWAQSMEWAYSVNQMHLTILFGQNFG